MFEFQKKKPYSIKKLKYKINSCVFVRSPLYEMVFVRNGLCMKLYVKIKVPPRTKNPCSKWLLCFCTKWSPLYEVVFVRNGLCTKWLDTERFDTVKFYAKFTTWQGHKKITGRDEVEGEYLNIDQALFLICSQRFVKLPNQSLFLSKAVGSASWYLMFINSTGKNQLSHSRLLINTLVNNIHVSGIRKYKFIFIFRFL